MKDDVEKGFGFSFSFSFGKEPKEILRLPFKLLVISEFAPKGFKPSKPKRVLIDKDNFNEVLGSFGFSIRLSIPNKISDTPSKIKFTLPIKDIKSFQVESIVENFQPLSELLQVRKLLSDLSLSKVSFDQAKRTLSNLRKESTVLKRIEDSLEKVRKEEGHFETKTPSFAKAKGQDDEIKGILDLVDVPESTYTEDTRSSEVIYALNQFIQQIQSPQKAPVLDKRRLNNLIGEIDAALTSQVNEILHDSEFKRLEACWRSIKFLVDRIDFRKNIYLEILYSKKEDLKEVLEEHILKPAQDKTEETPISALIGDYEFDASLKDLDLLKEIAKICEEVKVPFLTSIGPSFLGLERTEDLLSLLPLYKLFEKSQYIKWNEFRRTSSSRWVVFVFNRFLLRLPYGPHTKRVKGFAFQEYTDDIFRDYLWSNPAYALGSLLAKSFARYGWATKVVGAGNGGLVEDLPLRPYYIRGESIQIPLEVILSEKRQKEFAENGIIAFVCKPNNDSAYILSAPTLHKPERYGNIAENEQSYLRSTLPFQLFVCPIVNWIERIKDEVVYGNTSEEIREEFTRRLNEYLGSEDIPYSNKVKVEVFDSQEFTGYKDVIIKIFSDPKILGKSAHIELRFQFKG